MHNSDIEDNDPTPFVLEEWIGKGRQLPNAIDTPSGLEEHFSMLREVPDDIKHKCYPNTDLSIESFIKYQLPKRTYALPGLDALGCFNQREGPNRCYQEIAVVVEKKDQRSIQECWRQT
ncbi:hypothetical protein BGW80DRAFT_1255788 [Lactifluus volemus]|nr:hypothetical protein BGW80DRAFT_1255788 [Lactifluus volemus]